MNPVRDKNHMIYTDIYNMSKRSYATKPANLRSSMTTCL